MRSFLKILSSIATTFLFFEKSLSRGYQSDLVKELANCRSELAALRLQLKKNIEVNSNGQ